MWLLGTWGWTEPLSQTARKQIMWQWATVEKGVKSSSNSLWKDSVRKLNSHDELKRRNCQDRLRLSCCLLFLCRWSCRWTLFRHCIFFRFSWRNLILSDMSINVTKHGTINCIVPIYELDSFNEFTPTDEDTNLGATSECPATNLHILSTL